MAVRMLPKMKEFVLLGRSFGLIPRLELPEVRTRLALTKGPCQPWMIFATLTVHVVGASEGSFCPTSSSCHGHVHVLTRSAYLPSGVVSGCHASPASLACSQDLRSMLGYGYSASLHTSCSEALYFARAAMQLICMPSSEMQIFSCRRICCPILWPDLEPIVPPLSSFEIRVRPLAAMSASIPRDHRAIRARVCQRLLSHGAEGTPGLRN